jgi:hypothetical protein
MHLRNWEVDMLPREVSRLLVTLSESNDAELDVARLRSELQGIATFHRTLVDRDLLTDQQRMLFGEHVGKYVEPGTHSFSITAPAEGVPNVHLYITAPPGGVPPLSAGSVRRVVKCPVCKTEFTLKS